MRLFDSALPPRLININVSKYAGIDYSITSPAICVFTGSKFQYDSCKFYSLSDHKLESTKQYKFSLHKPWTINEERYDNISNWAMDIIKDCDYVAMEGYSMGSRGKTFNLGENTGLLKWKIWQADKKFQVYPPKVIKKFATGNGNANKELMHKSWQDKLGIDLKSHLQPSRLLGSPTTDIVDAYYICEYLTNNT